MCAWTGGATGKGGKVEGDIVDAETWKWDAEDAENEVKEVGEDVEGEGEWECHQ